MTEYLVTIQMTTSYTVPVLAEDKEQATAAALEQYPPYGVTQDTQKTVAKILRLVRTDLGFRYFEDRAGLVAGDGAR